MYSLLVQITSKWQNLEPKNMLFWLQSPYEIIQLIGNDLLFLLITLNLLYDSLFLGGKEHKHLFGNKDNYFHKYYHPKPTLCRLNWNQKFSQPYFGWSALISLQMVQIVLLSLRREQSKSCGSYFCQAF